MMPFVFMLWNSISNVLENTEIIEMWIKRIWNFWCLVFGTKTTIKLPNLTPLQKHGEW
jgi:hypothetical protein